MGAQNRDLPVTYREALIAARQVLSSNRDLILKGVIEPEAEQIVIAAVRLTSGKVISRSEIFTKSPEPYPQAAAEKLLTLAQQRAEGALLQHLTGVQQFLDHEYEVSRHVLIPRPETEILALTAIRKLESLKRSVTLGLEVGLGSGVLSIELLSRFPGLTMQASEVSVEAIEVARSNANRILGIEPTLKRLQIFKATDVEKVMEPFDLLLEAKSPQRADFLICNPPYLTAFADETDLEVETHEPWAALFAPEGNPLFFYERIAEQAALYLKDEGGLVFLEIPHERSEEIEQCFRMNSWYTEIIADLTERPRVLVATRTSNG